MKNQEIQGLRGLTAIVVFISHVIIYVNAVIALEHTPLGVFFSGSAAVMMFFFLSGYFAYRIPFSWEKTGKSILRKVLRLYPPYIFSLLLGLCGMVMVGYSERFDPYFGVTLAHSWSQSFSIRDFIIQCFMVIKQTNAGNLNPPVWTMIIEMRMVFLLPFFYLPLYCVPIFKRKSCIISYYLFIILLCDVLNSHVGISLFHWVPAFILGGVLHHAIKLGWFDGLKKWNNALVYLSIAVGICLMALGRNYTIPRLSEDIVFPISSVGCMVICALIICKPDAFKMLASKFMVFMGDISYYFYLVHWIVIAMLRGMVVYMVETIKIAYPVSYIIYVAVGFIISVIVAETMRIIMGKLEEILK